MLKYSIILALLITVSWGAQTIDPQQCLTIATAPNKGLSIRLWNADVLLKHNHLSNAATSYLSILDDPKCKADLEWTLLAASGLAECGDIHKTNALIILWKIANNSNASDEIKTDANRIIAELQSSTAP